LTEVVVTVLTVPAGDAELAADRLMVSGAFAVEERPADGGRVELRSVLADTELVARERLGALPSGWSLQLERIDATPADTWRDFVEPIRVAADLVLRPAWLPSSNEHGVTEVAIEPASTFGLGDHPTTRLSAAAVWRLAGVCRSVLDVGSGSGVLAIVALLAGATTATAIDVAETSPGVVLENARRNHVDDRIDASTTRLADVDEQFDLVIANILAPALIELAADLLRVTSANGVLVVSGVLADRHDHVLSALAPMRVVRTEVLDGWAAVELRLPDHDSDHDATG
jgi:ribosomal protein L11 methyltransferase